MTNRALRFASVALALAAPLAAQARASSDSVPAVRGSYDPEHNLTSLRIAPFPISEQLSLSVLALVGGSLPAEPTVVMFIFSSSASGQKYRQNHRVRIVVDSRTATVDEDGWWGPARRVGDQEQVIASLDAEQFSKIADGSRVTLNIGPTRVELSARGMARLRELALRMARGGASVAMDTVSPGGMVFDSTRLRSYSNVELITLLSQESLDRNVSVTGGLVNLAATSPSAPAGPVTAAARDSEHRAFSLSITPASSLRYPDAVVQELVRRAPTAEMLQAFDSSADLVQLSWLEAIFERIRTPALDSRLALIAGQPDTLDPNLIQETTYYALKYFANEGKVWALQILNCEYARWPVSSIERAEVVPLFGKFKYSSAAPNLAETIDAMFLNLGDAAMTSLKQMFPAGRTDFRSPVEAAKYWRGYVREHYKGPRDDARHCRAAYQARRAN